MNIETFSEKTADLLAEQLGLCDVPSLYELSAADLVGLPGFGEKRAENLVTAIQKSKQCKLASFLFALGIPNVGVKTARDLARRFQTLENLRAASREQLLAVDEIGDAADAAAILDARRCGVAVLATAHAGSFADAMRRESLARMLREGAFDRMVLLGSPPGCIRGIYDCLSGEEIEC